MNDAVVIYECCQNDPTPRIIKFIDIYTFIYVLYIVKKYTTEIHNKSMQHI